MGHYLIRQKAGIGIPSSNNGIIDLFMIQVLLQQVERKLNVFGDVGAPPGTRKNTRFRALNGALPGTLNTPHMAVVHPEIGNTYLPEAIDWMRNEVGVPSYGWDSVPAQSEWPLNRFWKKGRNRRHAAELIEAIGRVVDLSSEVQPWPVWNGVLQDSGDINYSGTTGPYEKPSASIQIGSRVFSVGEFSKATRAVFKRPPVVPTAGWYLQDPAEPPTEYSAFDWTPSMSGLVQVAQRPDSGPPSGGATLLPFEEAYEDKIIIKYLTPPTESSPDDEFTGGSWVAQGSYYWSNHIRRTQTIAGDPYWSEPTETQVLQDDDDSYGPIAFEENGSESNLKSSEILPATVDDLFGGSFAEDDKYFWAIPDYSPISPITPPDSAMESVYAINKSTVDEFISEDASFPYVHKGGYTKVRESFFRYMVSNISIDPAHESSPNLVYITWKDATLPIAEGWPDDPFTN